MLAGVHPCPRFLTRQQLFHCHMDPQATTHEFNELLAMITEIRNRLDALESPECETKRRPKDVQEVILFCAKCGLAENDARWLYAKMECSGWRNAGKVVRNWHSLITAWKIAAIFPSQKVNGHQSLRDLQAARDAKQQILNGIRDKYSSETASGRVWMPSATQQVRLEAKKIAGEIKELTAKIAGGV